jgi:hypothetical protein
MCCLSNSPCRLEAIAIPKAAEIEVEVAYAKCVIDTRSFLGNRISRLIVCLYENHLFFRSVFYVRRLDAPRPKSINHLGVKYIVQCNGEFDNA